MKKELFKELLASVGHVQTIEKAGTEPKKTTESDSKNSDLKLRRKHDSQMD